VSQEQTLARLLRVRWLAWSLGVFGLLMLSLVMYGKSRGVEVHQGVIAHINDLRLQPESHTVSGPLSQPLSQLKVGGSAPTLELAAATGSVAINGHLAHQDLTEASGLAISTRDPGVLFAINDSGNEPRLFALDHAGQDLGTWLIAGVSNIDWEDLASFELQGKHYLLIADTGDNLRWRSTMVLYVVETPDLTAPLQGMISVAWQIEFQFEHGPRDSEAVAVDVAGMQIFLVSKRTVPAEVYRLSLKPVFEKQSTKQSIKQMAQQIGVINLPRPTSEDWRQDPVFGQYRSQPTAMDISGNRLVILTYKDAWLINKQLGQDWAMLLMQQPLGQAPERIILPSIHQQEAVALGELGRRLWVTGEQINSEGATPLMVMELLEPRG
jgi:hypothetical protein